MHARSTRQFPQFPPLAFAGPPPNAELLAITERVLEAFFLDGATSADCPRCLGATPSLRKEDFGVDTKAGGTHLPSQHLLKYRHLSARVITTT